MPWKYRKFHSTLDNLKDVCSIRLKKGVNEPIQAYSKKFIWPISSLYIEIHTAGEARQYKNSAV